MILIKGIQLNISYLAISQSICTKGSTINDKATGRKSENVIFFHMKGIRFCSLITAFNPKRNMQKILTLKYMRGPRGPQKCNGMT